MLMFSNLRSCAALFQPAAASPSHQPRRLSPLTTLVWVFAMPSHAAHARGGPTVLLAATNVLSLPSLPAFGQLSLPAAGLLDELIQSAECPAGGAGDEAATDQ